MRQLFLISTVALGLVACTEEEVPDSDWSIYTQIIEKSPPDATDIARCTSINEPSLAGDCALTVALTSAKDQKLPFHSHCPQVPQGLWREECHFVAAEKARSAGEIDVAIELCEKSGRFAPDCSFHLWQRAMRTLAKRVVLDDLTAQQETMHALHARWSERVGHMSDFDSMFWRKLFRAVWDGVARVDPSICEALRPDLQIQCELGAQIHLDQAMRASLRSETWAGAFCATELSGMAALSQLPDAFPELERFPEHPAHLRVVKGFHHAHCTNGELPPHPDPPRRALKKRVPQDRTIAPTQSK